MPFKQTEFCSRERERESQASMKSLDGMVGKAVGVVATLVLFHIVTVMGTRTFSIDYGADTFRLDGKPFRYVSGSMHYMRVPRELWRDRMLKIRAAGFNALQFVVEWNIHEPSPGKFDFSGQKDINAYIALAQEVGLYVHLRPGPYICAERNGGGLPFWLYQLHPDIKLRSSDPNFLHYADKWWNVLLPRIRTQLYKNGGPILLVQVENEYGSYGLQTQDCDIEYMSHLRDQAIKHLGDDVVLYTTDGDADDYVRCGKVPGVYATVDFGPGTNVTNAFNVLRNFEPHGPLVNSEYYPGWLDYWSQPHHTVPANQSAVDLDEILATGASVNIYMAHGGTSFGFEAGANTPPFSVEPTSYDYDAPITECGDLTEKYYEFKKVISKYMPLPNINITEPIQPKGNYGPVEMFFVSTFFDGLGIVLKHVANSTLPLTFEQLGQGSGFVLYQTTIKQLFTDPAKLEITGVHDRAYIFLDQKPQGILSRAEGVSSMPLSTSPGDNLQILVENQGRIGYGPDAKDFKGIVSNVTLGGKVILTDWQMFSMPLNNTIMLSKYVTAALHAQNSNEYAALKYAQSRQNTLGTASFWVGHFTVPCSHDISLDTFLEFPGGWSKGVAFLNGFNLGRYWPIVGPQKTLYVPGVKLRKPCQKNELILFEQENPGCKTSFGTTSSCYIHLVNTPVINGSTPINVSDDLPMFVKP